MRLALALGLAAALLLPGCAILQEPQVKEVSGPTDGYTPTPSYLKLNLKRSDGSYAMLDFDRRDWYAAKIADLVDHKQVPFVDAQAKPRDILNEYVAQSVSDPNVLAKLRYDDMNATKEDRQQMDNEYQALLDRYLAQAPVQPTQLLPTDPLP